MMFKTVGSIAVLVKDAKKSAEWYREKLGFETRIEGHWVTAKPKGSEVVLHLCEKNPDWGKDTPGGNTGIFLECEDKERTYRELKLKGVKFTKELTRVPWGQSAVFQDPDGNEFWM